MRAHALILLLGACTSQVSPPTPPSCRDTCAGCCDENEHCQTGALDLACGSTGARCAACHSTQQCVNLSCGPRPPVGCAATCSGCCDDGDACRAGRSPAVCGEGGAACIACPTGTLCSAGACIIVTRCDSACGAQCCADSACDATVCGADGGSCATCPGGQLCSAGACATGLGTRWKLRVVSARIAELRPNGLPWDDKNDPDPKVCAKVSDAGQSCTLEQGETFTPSWAMTFPTVFTFDQLEQVELSVIDVDFPGETVVDELGVLDLRPRWGSAVQRWSIDGASVTQLKIEVVPQ